MTSYKDPNLGLGDLIIGAALQPWEVEANPALDLLALEDPKQFMELMKAIVEGWRKAGMKALSEKSRRLYACDCAERALYFFEAKNPTDLRPKYLTLMQRADGYSYVS